MCVIFTPFSYEAPGGAICTTLRDLLATHLLFCVQPEFVTTRTVKSNAKVENDFGWGHPVCKRHPKLSLSKDLQIF